MFAGLLALTSLAAVQVRSGGAPATRPATGAVMWQREAPRQGDGADASGERAVVSPDTTDLTVQLYQVRAGDTWDAVATRFGTSSRDLRAANPDAPPLLRIGQQLEVWFDGVPPPPRPGGLSIDVDRAGLTLAPIPQGSESVGAPDRGRLVDGARMPDNPALYFLRRPSHAYGSSYMLEHLQLGVAKFRASSAYPRAVVISDLSQRGGRPFARHHSHQSGRDVDIWLPTVSSVPQGTAAARPRDVDWDASWALAKALVRTGSVQFIFLSHRRQRHLYQAAQRDGMTGEQLELMLQYPRRSRSAIIRHAPGHDKHMHVRFHCGPTEARCR